MATQAYYTPPMSPSRQGDASTSSHRLAFPFSLDSPPPTISSQRAHGIPRSPRVESFDRVVGSPPRAPSRTKTIALSLPVTPAHESRDDATRALPWTWPLRGAGSVDWYESESPSSGKSGGTRRMDKGIGSAELATRYVYVEGVPLNSTEADIKSMFIVSRARRTSSIGD